MKEDCRHRAMDRRKSNLICIYGKLSHSQEGQTQKGKVFAQHPELRNRLGLGCQGWEGHCLTMAGRAGAR